MVSGQDGSLVDVHRATNIERSSFRFVIEPREQLQILNRIEDAGQELAAIYHSHTRTAPEPSQTDINFSRSWPGVLWIIVGLAEGEPVVRTWRIEGEAASEVTLDVG